MRLVLVTRDLMLISAAEGLAAQHGAHATTVGGVAAAGAACAEPETAALVAVDLRTPGLDVAALVAAVRRAAPSAAILAFGPHVHEAALAAARAAGCDEVVTRGQFEQRLAAALARLAT
ncbi:MAG TPA: histidine kinase [Lacipirellulaceae bacterium]|nr:histidine kinase [Lacipirellulaceae bacterium]